MLVERIINGVEIEVDTQKGGEIYFDENYANKLQGSGINDILSALYEEKKHYIPASLMMEITNACNFNCPFCYIHTCKDKIYMKSGEQWIKELSYLISKGLLCVTITGGECMLHPDFTTIYKYLKEQGVLVTILSNLSLLTNEILETFIKLPPYKVDVTIYGIDNKNMQKATEQTNYSSSLVLENIIKLKNAGINITCKTPGNLLTIDEIEKIENWCKKNQITYFSSLEIFDNYDDDSMEKYALSKEKIIMDHIETRKKKYKENIHEYGYKTNFDCKGGQYGLFISYNNFLRPCMPFYSISEANFDITHLGLAGALYEMERFIHKYKGERLAYCQGCNVAKLCQECVITQLRLDANELNQFMHNICEENKAKYIKTNIAIKNS